MDIHEERVWMETVWGINMTANIPLNCCKYSIVVHLKLCYRYDNVFTLLFWFSSTLLLIHSMVLLWISSGMFHAIDKSKLEVTVVSVYQWQLYSTCATIAFNFCIAIEVQCKELIIQIFRTAIGYNCTSKIISIHCSGLSYVCLFC